MIIPTLQRVTHSSTASWDRLVVRGTARNQAELELVTSVPTLQYGLVKSFLHALVQVKSTSNSGARTYMFLSTCLSQSLWVLFAQLFQTFLWYNFQWVWIIVPVLIYFLICVAFSSRSVHLFLEILFWDLLKMSPSVPLIGWGESKSEIRMGKAQDSKLGLEGNWPLSKSGSLCTSNISFLEHRGPEEITLERKHGKEIPCGHKKKTLEYE